MNTSLGYSKLTLDDTNVLLSGGGSKSLGDFLGSILWDSTNKKLLYKSASATNWTDLVLFAARAFDTNTYTYWGLQFTGTSIDGIMTFGANTFALSTDYTNTWSDGTNAHPWYGYDHRYANTGIYSTTISDYYGLTLKTYLGNLSITSDGKVGINNTTPSYRLHVSGDGMFTGHLYVGNATYTNSEYNDILTVGGSIRITGGSGSSGTGNYVRRIYFGDGKYAYIGEYCDEDNDDYDSDSIDIYSNNALYLRCDGEVQILQNTEINGALTVSGNVSAPNLIKIVTKATSNITLDANTLTQANTLYRSLGDLNSGTNVVWSNWPDTLPSGGYSLINISEGNYNRQIAGLFGDNHLYVRSLIYNQGVIWKSWNKILLDSDTGHNNGLDADTIDGLHASNLVKLASTTATSLTNLDTSKSFIYATLSSSVTASAFTLSGTMSVGLVLTILVLNNGSTTINITIPSTWKTLDDYTLAVGANKFIEISILCYANNSYIVSSKGQ